MSDAVTWAKAQRVGNPIAKNVLAVLASWADADGFTWAKISVIAFELERSERQVQRGLSYLLALEDGPIERTDQRIRRDDRFIPVYRLRLDTGPANTRIAMRSLAETGDAGVTPRRVTRASPGAETGDTGVTPTGDTDVTRHLKEDSKSYREGSHDPSQGARGIFLEVLEVWTSSARNSRTEPAEAQAAWDAAVAGGVDPERLAAAVRGALAADPDFKRLGVPGLQLWLAKGKFVGWLERGAPPARPRFPDAEIRSQVADTKGEPFAVSYLDPSKWDAEARTIAPRTTAAWRELHRCHPLLADLGVKVLDKGG
ncbi:MAG: hypothetical protein KGL39_43325 [Patescibacteria group bacterium]|nr:hypothetical protein [Patescibacteria group bacterium]